MGVRIPLGRWPGGTYFSDGSGGDPPHRLLRRCGVGIALMEGVRLVFGGGVPLPGEGQSVCRAELFAIVILAGQVKDEEVLVWTDSDYVAKGFEGGGENPSHAR